VPDETVLVIAGEDYSIGAEKMKLDLITMYTDYLHDVNKQKVESRYTGREEWFHASGAGMCLRKHRFAHIDMIESAPKSDKSMRLLRLGELVHDDFEKAVHHFVDKYNIEDAELLTEQEIKIPEWNVRGFFDVVIGSTGILYDIKTASSFKFKKLFGRSPDPKEYDKRLRMALVYYNKDNSQIRELFINRNCIRLASEYWKMVNEQVTMGVPPVHLGTSPAYGWECNPEYCQYFKHCGGGLKPELLKRKTK
jgi:hypothetical protein